MTQATQTQVMIGGAALAGIALYLYQKQQAALTANDPQAGTGFIQSAINTVDVVASKVVNLVTSRGYRNNNPGNLRFILSNPFNGQVGNDGGYGMYDTPQNGTRALGRQLLAYYNRGLDTLDSIVSTYAPATDNNNVSAYIADLAAYLNLDPGQPFDVPMRLSDLGAGIARHENGYLDSGYDWQWCYL